MQAWLEVGDTRLDPTFTGERVVLGPFHGADKTAFVGDTSVVVFGDATTSSARSLLLPGPGREPLGIILTKDSTLLLERRTAGDGDSMLLSRYDPERSQWSVGTALTAPGGPQPHALRVVETHVCGDLAIVLTGARGAPDEPLTLWCVDTTAAKVLWTRPLWPERAVAPYVGDRSHLVLATPYFILVAEPPAAHLLAFDTRTGAEKWKILQLGSFRRRQSRKGTYVLARDATLDRASALHQTITGLSSAVDTDPTPGSHVPPIRFFAAVAIGSDRLPLSMVYEIEASGTPVACVQLPRIVIGTSDVPDDPPTFACFGGGVAEFAVRVGQRDSDAIVCLSRYRESVSHVFPEPWAFPGLPAANAHPSRGLTIFAPSGFHYAFRRGEYKIPVALLSGAASDVREGFLVLRGPAPPTAVDAEGAEWWRDWPPSVAGVWVRKDALIVDFLAGREDRHLFAFEVGAFRSN